MDLDSGLPEAALVQRSFVNYWATRGRTGQSGKNERESRRLTRIPTGRQPESSEFRPDEKSSAVLWEIRFIMWHMIPTDTQLMLKTKKALDTWLLIPMIDTGMRSWRKIKVQKIIIPSCDILMRKRWLWTQHSTFRLRENNLAVELQDRSPVEFSFSQCVKPESLTNPFRGSCFRMIFLFL